MTLFEEEAIAIIHKDIVKAKPKSRTRKKASKPVQMEMFTLVDGNWAKKPLTDYKWLDQSLSSSKKVKREIDWTSKLTLEAFDMWLIKKLSDCKRYAIFQSNNILSGFLSKEDCEEEGHDAAMVGIMKVRKILQEGPLTNGTFDQYTKIAIKRVLIDRNRRDLAKRSDVYSGYRMEIKDEYEQGQDIEGVESRDPGTKKQAIMDFLMMHYKPVDDIILWELFFMYGESSSEFRAKRKSLHMEHFKAVGKAKRVMEFLKPHICNLSVDQAVDKLKENT